MANKGFLSVSDWKHNICVCSSNRYFTGWFFVEIHQWRLWDFRGQTLLTGMKNYNYLRPNEPVVLSCSQVFSRKQNVTIWVWCTHIHKNSWAPRPCVSLSKHYSSRQCSSLTTYIHLSGTPPVPQHHSIPTLQYDYHILLLCDSFNDHIFFFVILLLNWSKCTGILSKCAF